MIARRRRIHPLSRLALAMGVAARDIALPAARVQAARDAENIPVSNIERGRGKKGEMARLGRATLASLPGLAPEQFADAQSVLRGCRDAVMARFEETSFVQLGRRRRGGTRPVL